MRTRLAFAGPARKGKGKGATTPARSLSAEAGAAAPPRAPAQDGHLWAGVAAAQQSWPYQKAARLLAAAVHFAGQPPAPSLVARLGQAVSNGLGLALYAPLVGCALVVMACTLAAGGLLGWVRGVADASARLWPRPLPPRPVPAERGPSPTLPREAGVPQVGPPSVPPPASPPLPASASTAVPKLPEQRDGELPASPSSSSASSPTPYPNLSADAWLRSRSPSPSPSSSSAPTYDSDEDDFAQALPALHTCSDDSVASCFPGIYPELERLGFGARRPRRSGFTTPNDGAIVRLSVALEKSLGAELERNRPVALPALPTVSPAGVAPLPLEPATEGWGRDGAPWLSVPPNYFPTGTLLRQYLGRPDQEPGPSLDQQKRLRRWLGKRDLQQNMRGYAGSSNDSWALAATQMTQGARDVLQVLDVLTRSRTLEILRAGINNSPHVQLQVGSERCLLPQSSLGPGFFFLHPPSDNALHLELGTVWHGKQALPHADDPLGAPLVAFGTALVGIKVAIERPYPGSAWNYLCLVTDVWLASDLRPMPRARVRARAAAVRRLPGTTFAGRPTLLRSLSGPLPQLPEATNASDNDADADSDDEDVILARVVPVEAGPAELPDGAAASVPPQRPPLRRRTSPVLWYR